MKSINHDAIDAQLDGTVFSKKLKIASNWKMFKELISGIYSDKAYAIARETIANGIDSHEAAGIQSRPLEVHVPTFLEPHYSIRDFGVSMKRDLMEAVYCTLGESTKDDPNSDESNRYVGKFGLGSKSPFAYTDSFQVTAFYDGKAHMYDIFKGAEGPEMALLAIAPSEEEQGILVSFGVNPKDVNDFTRAIKRAIEGLDVVPLLTGVPADFSLHKRTILSEGNGWRLQDATQSGKAEARQGTVLYPLNFQAVIDCPVELKALFEQPFRFEFPIGSLDIVTSREALSYDEETSVNIINRLKQVQADIVVKVNSMISGAETYWDFCQSYKEAMKTFPENRFGKILVDLPTFKGRKPKEIIDVKTSNVVIKAKYDGQKLLQEQSIKFRFGSLTYCKVRGGDFSNSITFREDKDRRSNRLSVNIDQKLIIVTEDLREKNRYPAARIRKVLDMKRPGPLYDYTLIWFRHMGESQYALNRMFAAFGRPEMELINLLDVPHDVPQRQYSTGPRMPYKTLTSSGGWNTPEPTDIIPDEAYFVPMRNGDVDFEQGHQFNAHFMAESKANLVALGMDDLPIVGIPASSKKILVENPHWVPYYAHVKSLIDDMYDANAYKRLRHSAGWKSVPNLVNLIESLKEKANKTLFKEAFGGTVIDQIMSEWTAYSKVDGDEAQTTVIDIISRIEDKRVSEAKKANAVRRSEWEYMQIDNPSADISDVIEGLEDETNRAHTLRDEMDAFKVTHLENVDKLCEEVYEQFPLFRIISTYDLDREEVVADILNYVFNKRLMAVEAEQMSVDTAATA